MPGLRGNLCGALDVLVFGDGSNGDATFAADASLSGNMYYRNLTINEGVRLRTNGHKVRVRERCWVKLGAFVSNDGQDSRNSVGGAAEVSSSVPAGSIGGVVGTTGGGGRGGAGMYNGGRGIGELQHPIFSGSSQQVPAVDVSTTPGVYCMGGKGGDGGDAATGSLSGTVVGGTLVLSPGSDFYLFKGGLAPGIEVLPKYGGCHGFFTVLTCGTVGLSGSGYPNMLGTFFPVVGGTGGGGGACAIPSGTLVGARPRGGWGGGAGGDVFIVAREMEISGTMSARGGRGGNTSYTAGGGGGGGGGFVFLGYCVLKTLYDPSRHIDVRGGEPGRGQEAYGTMTGSKPGGSGSFILYNLN